MSSMRATIIPVRKPDWDIRPCKVYKDFNEEKNKYAYPIPQIDDIFHCMTKTKVFSTLHAFSGYYKVKIKDNDVYKLDLHAGQAYELLKIPFVFVNAQQRFRE